MIPLPSGLREAGIMADINVTPMIDVMIVLLILFMVVTPVLTNYAVSLPQAAHGTSETEAEVVEVGIDRSGAYWIDGVRVAPDRLGPYLTEIYTRRPGDHLLYLRGDGSIEYARILDAVGAARSAGVRRIGIITEPVRPSDADEPSYSERN